MDSGRYSLRPRATTAPVTKKPPGLVGGRGSAQSATPPHTSKPASALRPQRDKSREGGMSEQGPAPAAAPSLSAPANESQEPASAESSLTEIDLETSFQTTIEENQDEAPASASSGEEDSIAETLLPPKPVEIRNNDHRSPGPQSEQRTDHMEQARQETAQNGGGTDCPTR